MDQSLTSGVTTRRRFFLSAGLLGVASVLAACTQQRRPRRQPRRRPPPTSRHHRARGRGANGCRSRQADRPRQRRRRQPRQPPPPSRPPRRPRPRRLRSRTSRAIANCCLSQGGTQGKYLDYELWNPYAIGANHQTGPNLIYEPLAYYSAFADKEYIWLAESYEYSPDFKQLTIKTAHRHQLERRHSRSAPRTSPTRSTR